MSKNIEDNPDAFSILADSLGDWRPETRQQRARRLTKDYVSKKMESYRKIRKASLKQSRKYLLNPKKHKPFYKKNGLGKPIIISYTMQEEFASNPENLPKEVNKNNKKRERRDWNDVEPAWRAADPRRRMSWPEFCRDFMGQNYGAIAQSLMSLAVSDDKGDNVQFLKFMMEMGKQGNPQAMQLDLNAKVEQRSSMYAVLAGMAAPLDATPAGPSIADQPTADALQYQDQASQLPEASEMQAAFPTFEDLPDDQDTEGDPSLSSAYQSHASGDVAPTEEDQYDDYQEAAPPSYDDPDDDFDPSLYINK